MTYRKPSKLLRQKNLQSHPVPSAVERRILCSSTSRQRCEFSQVAVASGGGLGCAPGFSTAARSRGLPQFEQTLQPQILETDRRRPGDAFLRRPLMQLPVPARSLAHDRLAMLARKRWAHHSSRSMGTKSAHRTQRGRELGRHNHCNNFIQFSFY